MNPDGASTRIAADCTEPTRGIVALATREPVHVLAMTSRRMLAASGYLAKLFQVFAELDVPVDLIPTAEVSVAVTVEADAPTARRAGASLSRRSPLPRSFCSCSPGRLRPIGRCC